MDNEIEVYKQLKNATDKYTYFLLTAVGAAIALTINLTKDLPATTSQIPLAIALLLWGASFFIGCLKLVLEQKGLWQNLEFLKVQKGKHQLSGNDPDRMQVGMSVLRNLIEENAAKSTFYERLQFGALISGTFFFLLWHVTEMFLRSGVIAS